LRRARDRVLLGDHFSSTATNVTDGVIEYRLTTGEPGRVALRSVSYVSVLSDARGVIYTEGGGILVVLDGEHVFQQWRAYRLGTA
jgi:hypothetical protein